MKTVICDRCKCQLLPYNMGSIDLLETYSYVQGVLKVLKLKKEKKKMEICNNCLAEFMNFVKE